MRPIGTMLVAMSNTNGRDAAAGTATAIGLVPKMALRLCVGATRGAVLVKHTPIISSGSASMA